jgi:hypothetical protein
MAPPTDQSSRPSKFAATNPLHAVSSAQFLNSHGIEPAKAADQRICPTSTKCNFQRFYPNDHIKQIALQNQGFL